MADFILLVDVHGHEIAFGNAAGGRGQSAEGAADAADQQNGDGQPGKEEDEGGADGHSGDVVQLSLQSGDNAALRSARERERIAEQVSHFRQKGKAHGSEVFLRGGAFSPFHVCADDARALMQGKVLLIQNGEQRAQIRHLLFQRRAVRAVKPCAEHAAAAVKSRLQGNPALVHDVVLHAHCPLQVADLGGQQFRVVARPAQQFGIFAHIVEKAQNQNHDGDEEADADHKNGIQLFSDGDIAPAHTKNLVFRVPAMLLTGCGGHVRALLLRKIRPAREKRRNTPARKYCGKAPVPKLIRKNYYLYSKIFQYGFRDILRISSCFR